MKRINKERKMYKDNKQRDRGRVSRASNNGRDERTDIRTIMKDIELLGMLDFSFLFLAKQISCSDSFRHLSLIRCNSDLNFSGTKFSYKVLLI